MSTVTYTIFSNVLLHESRDAVESDYVPDTIGSTVTTLIAGDKVSEWTYWPYGEIRTTSGSSETPFLFVGTLGYYHGAGMGLYVRVRTYLMRAAIWSTAAHWPDRLRGEHPYRYCRNQPILRVDPSGRWDIPYPINALPPWFHWRPPFNPSEDDKFCRGRVPRSFSDWDAKLAVPCSRCIAWRRVQEDIPEAPPGRDGDKHDHFMGGCLARIRCGTWCPDNLGSMKEASDTLTGGTVSQADALATDDGWDAAGYYLNFTEGQTFSLNDVELCKYAYRHSQWGMIEKVF